MSAIDPVTLEILWTRLVSAVDEAAATFVRTSFSTLVREANDYAVVLTDRKGRNVAQSSQSIPSFISTMPVTIRHFIETFGTQNMREGDAFITNDPWIGTGHLNDASLAIPIFRDGIVIGFAGVVSHLPDVGGRLRNAANRELFEEGLQIPPMRILDGGKPQELLIQIIRANVRVPDETMGDIWAQIACCTTLADRLNVLIDETGIDFDGFADEVITRTGKAMQEAIAAVPDGTYRYVIENDGPAEMPGGIIRIACSVTVAGDRIAVDYTGSSDQVSLAINTVANYTFAYSAYALKALFAPWIPNNEGSFAAIAVTAPEGSILNPTKPAPCGARGMIGHLLPPAIFGALAPVLPDRVQASPGSPSNNVQLASLRGNVRYAINAFIGAGQGAGLMQDGTSAISFPSNLSNTPIEVLESQAPIEVKHRRIRRGSGGRGARNGGDGISFAFEMYGESPAIASFMVNRVRRPAGGLAGGEPGAAARFEINGKPTEPSGQYVLRQGDTVLIETAGGGGFGKPNG
ncbi:hydantoinase B [Aliidongia dinghuensis]|uniref:Hydantoinase B n=1 Tax=Aliidongia dinghuensis TaxID=1867774 RepID=A0A8J3E782_9PROT|nr:hydantoinase B/oxoprolinase family protein [Aliidongia dinghuensis]GGF49197.1 hydantoinase B [Aliidongia dinghuensis]